MDPMGTYINQHKEASLPVQNSQEYQIVSRHYIKKQTKRKLTNKKQKQIETITSLLGPV